MSKPFDATLKDLVQRYPADFLAALGVPASGPVEAYSPDLSTLTAAADVVLRRADGRLVHVEFESGPDAAVDRRTLLYNVVLYHREEAASVHSIVVLLRPAADRADLTGVVSYRDPSGRGGMDFRFEVARLWQRPMDSFLEGGPGTLPLEVLGRPPAGQSRAAALPRVIDRIGERLESEAIEDAPDLMLATFILTGLRLPRPVTERLFRGVRHMRDSTTYQGILDDGRIDGVRRVLLLQGRKRFGPPDAAAEAALQAVANLRRLEQLGERLLDAHSWAEWLAGSEPKAKRVNPRRK
jgi:predicted transposase YdaD